LHSALLRFSGAAALLYAAYAMCRAPVLPLYARELGAGPELIGLIAGASTLTGVVLKLPAGAWSDAIGRRAVLLTAGGIFALMPFTYPMTTTVLALFFVRFAHGSASALFGPTAYAALSDRAPHSERGRWLATYAAIQGSGQAAGPVFAGWMLASYGFHSTFVAAGTIGLLGWALTTRGVSHESRARPTVTIGAIGAAIRRVAANGAVVMTSLAQAAQFLLHGLVTAFLPIYAVAHAGLNPTEAGLLFGALMLTTIASRPLFGRLSDRVGRRPMIVIGLLASAISVAAIPVARGLGPLLAVAAFFGAGLAVTGTSTAALITDLSDRAHYGAAHGLFGTIYDVGDAIGPIAGGFIAASIGYERTFQLAALMVASSALVFALLSRRWVVTDAEPSCR